MISNVTKPEVITCKIEWKIFDLKRVAELVQDNQFLSSELYNPKFPSIVCELRIYPHCSRFHLNNKWYDEGAYVSLINVGQGEFLDENICNTIKAKCNIFTFSDGERKNIFSKAFELEGKTESYKHMIGLESIDTSEDGSTLLYCEIDFIPYYNIKPNKSGIENNQSTIRNTSQKTFTNMFEEGTLSDCLIKVGDETIKAHRCILAQNSKVFLRMFEQKGMKEAQKGEIKIVDSSPECFRAMIEYFYSGEITKINFEKLVDDLYVIAHKYEVLTLMDKCESFMSLNIDAANFTKRCHYAGLYGLPMLEKACIKYIFDNKNFLISNEWNEFKIANSTLAFRLLESVVNYDLIKY